MRRCFMMLLRVDVLFVVMLLVLTQVMLLNLQELISEFHQHRIEVRAVVVLYHPVHNTGGKKFD